MSNGFNIQEFSSNLNQRGTTQTNKFIVRMTPPIVIPFNNNISSLLEFRAEDVNIPGVTFDTVQTHRYGVGPMLKTPTNVNFSDNAITFIDDSDTSIWKFMSRWMNYIFDFTGSQRAFGGNPSTYSLAYKKNYAIDIDIYVYNNDGKNISIITLLEAYPVSLNDVRMSWSDNNSVFKTTTTFTFREWYQSIV